MYVIVQWGGVRVLCLCMSATSMSFNVVSHFLFLLLGPRHTFLHSWVARSLFNRKKAGSKDRREAEMYLTNVTAYQVCMHDHDKCHYVLYGRTVTVPSLHFR